MTKDEYISVCLKYSDYLNLTGSGTCYIKGAITIGEYQVTDVTYEDCIIDSDKIIGKIWYMCYSTDKKTIQTQDKICYYANTKELENSLEKFIRNCKELKIKYKIESIEKDFK